MWLTVDRSSESRKLPHVKREKGKVHTQMGRRHGRAIWVINEYANILHKQGNTTWSERPLHTRPHAHAHTCTQPRIPTEQPVGNGGSRTPWSGVWTCPALKASLASPHKWTCASPAGQQAHVLARALENLACARRPRSWKQKPRHPPVCPSTAPHSENVISYRGEINEFQLHVSIIGDSKTRHLEGKKTSHRTRTHLVSLQLFKFQHKANLNNMFFTDMSCMCEMILSEKQGND